MEKFNTVFVNAGLLMMPLSGAVVTTQQQEDIVNSMLLAQLSARAKYPQAQQQTEREEAVQGVLDNVFWVRLSQPRVVVSGAQTLTLADAVATESAGMFTSRVSEGFIELMAALKSLPSQEALTVWREQTASLIHTEHPASTDCPVPDEFNVCVRFAIIDAESIFHTLMFSFSTRTPLVADYLTQELVVESKGGLRVQGYTYELNEPRFATLRERIVEKLAGKRELFVMPWARSSTDGQPLVIPQDDR